MEKNKACLKIVEEPSNFLATNHANSLSTYLKLTSRENTRELNSTICDTEKECSTITKEESTWANGDKTKWMEKVSSTILTIQSPMMGTGKKINLKEEAHSIIRKLYNSMALSTTKIGKMWMNIG